MEQPPAIRTLDEWTVLKEQKSDQSTALLLQCGSPVCTRCPAFTDAIKELSKGYKFLHVYVNTHDAEEDLLEELQVTQLPAFKLLSERDGEEAIGQASTPDDIRRAVASMCTPVLTLDADF